MSWRRGEREGLEGRTDDISHGKEWGELRRERGLVLFKPDFGFPCYLMVERDGVTGLMSHSRDIFSSI